MLRVVQCGLLALAVWASPAVSSAALMEYTITVEVTAAGFVPGSYPSNPWSFGSVPATFVGTFDADDTAIGPVSNMALTIGGLDIAATHTVPYPSMFDPNTLLLRWVQTDPIAASFVVFGAIAPSIPVNYAVAIEGTSSAPFDPYLGATQNWVGTYSVAPSAVPEPASVTLVGLGAFGLIAGAIRRRRQQKIAV